MDRRLVFAIVGILVVLGGVSGYLVLHNQSTTQTTPKAPTMTMPVTGGTSNQAATGHSIVIQNFAFSPASLTVAKGTTVTWTNNDSTAHTVTETDGKKGPDSSSIDQGATYSFTYDAPGTDQYHCSIHPSMTGTVTVTE